MEDKKNYQSLPDEQKTFTREEVLAILSRKKKPGRKKTKLTGRRPGRPLGYHPPKKQKPVPIATQNRRANMLANRAVKVTLRLRHDINGTTYGPGEVTVSNSIATYLLHTESHQQQMESRFYGERAAIIGPMRNGISIIREVAPETFSTEYENAEPAVVQRVGNKQ